MRIVLMGPPGAGKGTQAVRLASSLGVAAISTGDVFRAHVRDRTELGQRIAGILDSGAYVPDDLTNALVRERLSEPDAAAGFVLDGYPRTLDQVTELDAMLADSHHQVEAVIDLAVGDDDVIERLAVRQSQTGRSDDTPEVVRARLAVYHEQTAPLKDEYGRRGLLVEIDGAYPPDEVERQIVAAVRTSARALS